MKEVKITANIKTIKVANRSSLEFLILKKFANLTIWGLYQSFRLSVKRDIKGNTIESDINSEKAFKNITKIVNSNCFFLLLLITFHKLIRSSNEFLETIFFELTCIYYLLLNALFIINSILEQKVLKAI